VRHLLEGVAAVAEKAAWNGRGVRRMLMLRLVLLTERGLRSAPLRKEPHGNPRMGLGGYLLGGAAAALLLTPAAWDIAQW
jgi:hypothetical protein